MITCRSGTPSFFAVASMIRMLAWCGTSQSIASAVTPLAASASCATSASTLHGELEDVAAVHLDERRADDGAVGDRRRARRGCRHNGRRRAGAPRRCPARATARARPRRRRRRTARRSRGRSSRGCASRFRRRRRAHCAPCPRRPSGPRRPARRRSRCTPPARRTRRRRAAPSFACRMQAVDGNTQSGVVVATTMRSTSAGAMPAAASARARRVQREIARLLGGRGDAALADPGARANPLVARVDALREIRVGEDVRRQVAAGPDDAAMHRARRRRLPRPAPAWPPRSVAHGHRRHSLRDPVEHAVRRFGVRLVQRVT